MKIILPDGRVISSNREIIERMVKDSLAKRGLIREGQNAKPSEKTINGTNPKGEFKRVNTFQKESADEYIVEELRVELARYTKGDRLTKDGDIALFNAISKHAAAKKYYVGITCDLDRREGEHSAEFLAVIACPDKDKANDLEMTLDGKGYDAGDAVGNVHKVQSKKVYIYKKTSQTIE